MSHETGRRLHNMSQIPEGKSVADILQAFSDVKQEVYVGEPNKQCASCRKPFNAVRKPRQTILMYPMRTIIPICFSFDICGPCYSRHQAGGADRDGVLAAVEGYCTGAEAKQ